MKRIILLLLGLALAPTIAHAQSTPAFVTGQVPTAAQWNSYFAAKADAFNGTLTNPSMVGAVLSGTFSGAPTFSGDVTVGGAGIGLSLTGTGAMLLPVGSTGQRPDSGNVGEIRYNTTTARYEFGVGGSWITHVKVTGDTMTGALALGANLLSGSNVTFTGGTINGTTIGLTTPAQGKFAPSGAGTNAIALSGNITDAGTAGAFFNQIHTFQGFFQGTSSPFAAQKLILTSQANAGDLSNFGVGGVFVQLTDDTTAGSHGNSNGTGVNVTYQGPDPIGASGSYQGASFQGRMLGGANTRITRGWPINRYTNFSTPLQSNGGGAFGLSALSAIGNGGGESNQTGITVNFLNSGTHTGDLRSKIGVGVADLSSTEIHGIYDDVAYAVGGLGTLYGGPGPSFRNMISFGSPLGDFAGLSDGTLIIAQSRLYGGVANPSPQARYGIDFRQVTWDSGGSAFATANAGISDIGEVTGHTLTTDSIVQARTATLTSVTVIAAGDFISIPALTVAAPPSGTTATAAVGSMKGVGVNSFGATGRNYLVGDNLTPAGGVGTAPTLSPSAVDASGGVTTWVITNSGALTAPPANPVALTGGTGTGALVDISYSADGSTGIYSPTAITAAATGGGFATNDVLTVAGDTGTAVQFKVGSVTSDGGILITGMTVQVAGAVTAIAAGTYHSLTGGGGGGASFQVGYGINAVTVTLAGAGYLPSPPPLISVAQTDYLIANLRAVMTPAAATLSLNPTGGAIQGGSGAWTANGAVATALSSVGPTGAHTTVQEWFTVTNASGTVRYIPGF